MIKELWKLSISELKRGYQLKQFSPLEVIEEIVKKIKKDNSKLNAYVYFDEETVLNQARQVSKRYYKHPRGNLEGIPISIKDLLVTKDMPTYRGSLTSSLPINSDYDAPVVKKLKKQGAIILGKTATPEFGHKGTTQSLKYGDTKNPWNLSLNAGGSSGGSCAAVAAGLGPVSIGTDGGGSIRIPSSFCGLFGHKPTFGKIPAYPISPFGTIANVGPISRNVTDSAIIMNNIASPDIMDWHSLPSHNTDYEPKKINFKKNFKIGYSKFWGMQKYFNLNIVDNEITSKIEDTIDKLSEKGLIIQELDEINWPYNPLDIFMIMWQAGAANLARKIKHSDYKKMEPSILKFIENGNKFSMFDIMDVEEKRAANAIHMKNIFTDFNAIIGPTLPVLPFSNTKNVPDGCSSESLFSWLPFTYPFNLTKNPSSNLNIGFSISGLPIGLQIVSDIYKDKNCFELAFFIEDLVNLTNKWPKI